MINTRYLPLVFKQVIRHRTRTLLTAAGVATAMFLFCSVQAMQNGAEAATRVTASDTTLVVYRENRYCPAASRLPEDYLGRIQGIPGVKSVTPMRIVVNNCRTSLDVVTFRGVPKGSFLQERSGSIQLIDGSLEDWGNRSDAALLGETLATRRGLRVGDRFDAAGVTVYVAGIARSKEPQDQNVAYVHLPFLQRSTGDRKLGVVTQFNVRVSDPSLLEEVAAAIDAEFANDREPTQTSPEKAFVARAASDIIEIVGFTRWLGWACLAAVLALVGNAIVLSVQGRIRDHAVLQTLGYDGGLIARLIVSEGLVLSALGGLVGTLAAFLMIRSGGFAVSSEGFSIEVTAGPSVFAAGFAISVALGILAGLLPAWQASRREIAACFRAV